MKRLAMALVAALLVAAGLAAVGARDSVAEGKACVRTKFDTKLTEEACKKGGQDEAKKAWKAWTAEAKKTEPKMACKTCHEKQAPNYEVNATGLETYRKLGGK